MKLTRIEKPLRSSQVRITSPAISMLRWRVTRATTNTFTANLWCRRTLIPEILHAFLDADREFQVWRRTGNSASHVHGYAATSPNSRLKAPA